VTRLAALRALHRQEDAIAPLARTERDLPRDFMAPAHLARAFAAAARWDDALRAIDRALALAYGPYRVALFADKVDILDASGDARAALRTLDEALVLARSLSLTGAYARLRASLEARRAERSAR
jgi:tetratricopeptide (TPR) repeat protein